jgi:hypothetical protein
MKKNFLLRPLSELSLRQRIVHGLLTFGLPVFLLDVIFLEHTDSWIGELLIALFGGVIAGITLALLEHAFFRVVKKEKDTNR